MELVRFEERRRTTKQSMTYSFKAGTELNRTKCKNSTKIDANTLLNAGGSRDTGYTKRERKQKKLNRKSTALAHHTASILGKGITLRLHQPTSFKARGRSNGQAERYAQTFKHMFQKADSSLPVPHRISDLLFCYRNTPQFQGEVAGRDISETGA